MRIVNNKTTNCLYFHINTFTNEVFYIGIGSIERPYSKYDRSKWWHNIVNKYGYIVVIIHENLPWKEACELEIKYIAQIGRADLRKGTLVNMTDGGDGQSIGYKHSEETKRKIGKSSKKFWSGPQSEEIRKRMVTSQTGKHRSEEIKNKISISNTGKKLSEETKKKIGISSTGRKHSEEWKNKMSEKNSGINNPFYGKTHSEETRKKIRDALKKSEKFKEYLKSSERSKKIAEAFNRVWSEESKRKISLTKG